MPRIATIKTIASWLEVSWRWLYTGRGEMASERETANMNAPQARLPGYMELGTDERLLLTHYRTMSKEKKADVLAIVEVLAHRVSIHENDRGEIDLSGVTPPTTHQRRGEDEQPSNRAADLPRAKEK